MGPAPGEWQNRGSDHERTLRRSLASDKSVGLGAQGPGARRAGPRVTCRLLTVRRPLVRGRHGLRLQGLPGQQGPPADVHQQRHGHGGGQPQRPHGGPRVSAAAAPARGRGRGRDGAQREPRLRCVPRPDGCKQMDAEYLRTGSQGHFRVPTLGYLDVRVVDTDYSSFAVVYIYKELEGALSTLVQLYSRTQEASPQAMKTFQDFYPTVGLPHDMMVALPKSDACSSGGQGAP
uniref:Lipocalin/cytosolic fatty-acid binding domain-containing protein n=1 Tax=Sus scrofa TaxID=9823 RepID=A0A8D1M873_PIG